MNLHGNTLFTFKIKIHTSKRIQRVTDKWNKFSSLITMHVYKKYRNILDYKMTSCKVKILLSSTSFE